MNTYFKTLLQDPEVRNQVLESVVENAPEGLEISAMEVHMVIDALIDVIETEEAA